MSIREDDILGVAYSIAHSVDLNRGWKDEGGDELTAELKPLQVAIGAGNEVMAEYLSMNGAR